MLLGPNKAETAAHGCHYLDVRMRELMGTPRGWCKCVSTEYPTDNIGDHVQFQEPITNFLNSHTKPISRCFCRPSYFWTDPASHD